MPLIEIARAATEAEARAGLDRWREKYPDVWPRLAPADVLVDSMRGRSKTWTRIRVNLRSVPENERPPQEALEVDYDPWEGVEFTDEEREAWRAQQRSTAAARRAESAGTKSTPTRSAAAAKKKTTAAKKKAPKRATPR
jgi:hypothetical protein